MWHWMIHKLGLNRGFPERYKDNTGASQMGFLCATCGQGTPPYDESMSQACINPFAAYLALRSTLKGNEMVHRLRKEGYTEEEVKGLKSKIEN